MWTSTAVDFNMFRMSSSAIAYIDLVGNFEPKCCHIEIPGCTMKARTNFIEHIKLHQ